MVISPLARRVLLQITPLPRRLTLKWTSKTFSWTFASPMVSIGTQARKAPDKGTVLSSWIISSRPRANRGDRFSRTIQILAFFWAALNKGDGCRQWQWRYTLFCPCSWGPICTFCPRALFDTHERFVISRDHVHIASMVKSCLFLCRSTWHIPSQSSNRVRTPLVLPMIALGIMFQRYCNNHEAKPVMTFDQNRPGIENKQTIASSRSVSRVHPS